MKLPNLLTQITPLNWRTTGSLIFHQKNPGGRKTYIADCCMDPGANQTVANAAYMVHATALFPELVKALEDLVNEPVVTAEQMAEARAILARANEIKV